MMTIGWTKRIALIGLISALLVAAFPTTNVFAAGAWVPSVGETVEEVTGDRLERMWAHQQKAYERQGRMLEVAANLIGKVQNLIDRAAENGKDVSAIQAALDAFAAAVDRANLIYAQAGALVSAHAGFDEAGQVTDAALATQTMQDLAGKLQAIRELIGEPGKALREALKEFRELNKPAERPTRDEG
jgi:hypothetical protein